MAEILARSSTRHVRRKFYLSISEPWACSQADSSRNEILIPTQLIFRVCVFSLTFPSVLFLSLDYLHPIYPTYHKENTHKSCDGEKGRRVVATVECKLCEEMEHIDLQEIERARAEDRVERIGATASRCCCGKASETNRTDNRRQV